MALDSIIRGVSSGTGAEVSTTNFLKTVNETNSSNVTNVGCGRVFAENDQGTFVSPAQIISYEGDLDFRQRSAIDTLLDQENFNYTAQNTGKHIYRNTTMTFAWTANGLQTNSGSITTTTTGASFQTYAFFPILGASTLSFDMEMSFSAQPTANTVIDFGGFIPNTANPYAPADGAYFRLSAAGLQGVINFNGTETTTAVFPGFSYTNNTKYQFILYCSPRYTEFWYNDNTGVVSTFLLGVIPTPSGNGSPCASMSVPFSIRHSIVGGAAGSVIQATLSSLNVRTGGFNLSDRSSTVGNRALGSYQGLSGGTMGSLANYANNTNPTAVVPTNTTAALGTGLGGQFWETDTLAVNTDGIICSYQVPAGSVSFAGRRLVIFGVKIDSYIQTALTGGGYNAQWSLCFGHTAVSLATAEAATAKAPRRVAIGSNTVASGAVALTQLPTISWAFTVPIYVNPGEFVALARKKVGTAPSAGTVAHTILFDYGWE